LWELWAIQEISHTIKCKTLLLSSRQAEENFHLVKRIINVKKSFDNNQPKQSKLKGLSF
jgi:hypothetical protein